ncbi:BgTH12-01308 [Blumeria graminis f. sp. triticale]|nr:BgTH12-01308 [Blumeria graminis f. sp. triticale]
MSAYDNSTSAPNTNGGGITKKSVSINVKEQSDKVKADFSNLAAARTTPTTQAATGQPLTHYHSFFYSLLSWENPRASGIAYLASVFFIFAARYLNFVRYLFKITYVVLGITIMAEVSGKVLLSHGFTSQIRPKKYYTVPKETLNLIIADLHELINFFVIEAQQIIFAENLPVSIGAFVAALFSYFLVRFVPLWALCLLGTSSLFLGSLFYVSNQEMIDQHLACTADVINKQTEQVKVLASQQAARATKQTMLFMEDYSIKAQGMISGGRRPSNQVQIASNASKTEPSLKKENASSLNIEDFPVVPVEEFKPTPISEDPITLIGSEHNLISA